MTVEAAAAVLRDFIRGQEAAPRLDEAMAVMADWVQRQRRLNDRTHHEH
jgi:hypothetical protein